MVTGIVFVVLVRGVVLGRTIDPGRLKPVGLDLVPGVLCTRDVVGVGVLVLEAVPLLASDFTDALSSSGPGAAEAGAAGAAGVEAGAGAGADAKEGWLLLDVGVEPVAEDWAGSAPAAPSRGDAMTSSPSSSAGDCGRYVVFRAAALRSCTASVHFVFAVSRKSTWLCVCFS